MKVLESLKGKMRQEKLHMTLLDPDKLTPRETASLAVHACKIGTDAVMIGGSTGVTRQKVDATIKAIKSRTSIPVILFPSGKEGLSRHADSVYFMSLLNSKDVRMVVGEQRRASKLIKAWGLETISMGYLLVWPGMRAGEVGRAELIPRDDVDMAVQYALAAQFLGMDLVYLEAGSGAPVPVPPKMIRAVKKAISIPLVVGGGIRTPATARAAAMAGADIVVTGTIVEETGSPPKGGIVRKAKPKGHKAQALWAADIAEQVLPLFEEKRPRDRRPRKAIEAARAWAHGEMAFKDVRAAALAAHAAARAVDVDSPARASARAAGHAAATAHVARHSAGAAIYAAAAINLKEGRDLSVLRKIVAAVKER